MTLAPQCLCCGLRARPFFDVAAEPTDLSSRAPETKAARKSVQADTAGESLSAFDSELGEIAESENVVHWPPRLPAEKA
jgi:hypothetical protein